MPKDLVAYVNLGCDAHSTEHSYTLYSSTLSMFGSNMAMQRYYAHLASRAKDAEDTVTIFDPCLLRQMREQKDVVVGKRRTVRLYLIGIGNYTMCRERLEPLLNVSAPCSRPPCSASGIHQPVWSAETREFYGVSEYWYTTHETLRMGGRYAPEKFDWAAKVIKRQCVLEEGSSLHWIVSKYFTLKAVDGAYKLRYNFLTRPTVKRGGLISSFGTNPADILRRRKLV